METKENSNTWVDIDFAFPFSHFWDSFHESSWTIGAELYFEWTFTYAWNLEQLSFTPTLPHMVLCQIIPTGHLTTEFVIYSHYLQTSQFESTALKSNIRWYAYPPLRSLLFSFYLFPHQCRVFLSLIIKVFLLTNK